MKVLVPLDTFRVGDLGELCVSTGVPTRNRIVVRARYLPRWPLLALLAAPWGILVALGLPVLIGRAATGTLPCSTGAVRRVRRRRRIGWTVTLAVVVIGGAGATWAAGRIPRGLTVVWLAGVVVAVAFALGAALRPAGSILARLDRAGQTVILDGVSPAFAAAQADHRRVSS